MNKNRCLFFILCLFVGLHGAMAEESGLETFKAIYKKSLEKIDAEYQADLETLHDKYHTALIKILKQVITRSNLPSRSLYIHPALENTRIEWKSLIGFALFFGVYLCFPSGGTSGIFKCLLYIPTETEPRSGTVRINREVP